MDFDQSNGGRKTEEQLSTWGKCTEPQSELIMFNNEITIISLDAEHTHSENINILLSVFSAQSAASTAGFLN